VGNNTWIKPLRVLLVLTEFPPSIGGMQAHALYLSRYLANRGHNLEVVTYRTPNAEEQNAVILHDNEFSFPVHRKLSRLAFWHNIKVLGQISNQFEPDLIYCSTVFYGFLRDVVNVPIICRSAGNDVLRPWIAYPFRTASHLLAIPCLDDWLYNTFEKLKYPEWVETIFREKRRQLVNQSARKMDMIMANSSFTAALLSDLGVEESQIKIVVGGVDVERFSPYGLGVGLLLRRALGIDDDAYIITTICRLVPKKGIDFLLRAFHMLQKIMPDTHLLIVGDGRYRTRYQCMAQELGLSQKVTFTGSVSHLEIHRYYWISDLFVLASRIHVDPATGIRDAETMGRVLCEANAAGVAVLAARSGGIPSVIISGQNGLLFEPEDANDFLKKIRRIRNNPNLTQQLIKNGFTIANQKFDWSIILKVHEDCFYSVLKGYRKSPQTPREISFNGFRDSDSLCHS
jgi:phosphatidylinositol alpha-1,6-mannosyltransferase